MAKKDRRKKKKGRSSSRKRSGRMSGMRQGLKGFVGLGKSGSKKKESTLSKVLSWLLLAAAVGLLIYRFTR